jgi:hypothetical protein
MRSNFCKVLARSFPVIKLKQSRRGGRVVDGSGLENRRTRKGTGGSNPSLSAITIVIYSLQAANTSTDSELNQRRQ